MRGADGGIEGFYADIARAILEREGLPYEFVPGTWAEGLERLENGSIDVMVDVAWSAEREKLYDFGEETVFINWGVLYARAGLSPQTFADLQGLVVAGMKGGIHSEGPGGILALARQFEVALEYLPVDDYEAAFRAVEEGRADVAVVNRLFGLEREAGRRLSRTSLVFNPIALKFAFTKGGARTADLVVRFDRALRELKADKGGAYYKALARWLPGFSEVESVVPEWMRLALPAVSAALAIGLAFIVILSLEVRKRKRVERELVRAKEAAEAANKAKSVFLAHTSHEIRTPMNAILGYAQLLASEKGLDERQRGFVRKIAASGEHLLAVINEILDMSKIEAGKAHLEEAPFDLHAALHDAEAMARPAADAKGLSLSLEIARELPRYAIGDEAKFRQVALNLIGNAVKFTSRGGVRVAAGIDPGASGPGLPVRVEVSDTGPGIEEADLEKVFAPFERGGLGLSFAEGTGLGLSISRKLARLMGGDVSARSEPGRGSVFAFTARLKRSERGWRPAAKGPCADEGEPIRLAEPCSVLIADDRESNRDILARMLGGFGFEVLEARDGAEALEVYEERRPRIVLMDLAMPVIDGFEAIRAIRAREAASRLSPAFIMAVTASTLEEDRSKVMDAGADGFLRKPFKLPELLAALSGAAKFERGEGCPDDAEALEAEAPPLKLDGLAPETRKALSEALLIGDLAAFKELARGVEDAAVRGALVAAASRYDLQALKEALDG
jgi:signal transduction histidine kinase/CheY-like chemotaxis protein